LRERFVERDDFMNSSGATRSEQHPEEPQQPSNSKRWIERMKRSRLRPGQFRLVTLIVAISLLAVVLGAVRLSGGNYARFFSVCLGGTCVFLPFLAWFSGALLGIRDRRRRYAVAGGVTVSGFVAPAIAAAVYSPLREMLVVTSFVALVFWPLLAIWTHCLDVAAFGGTSARDPNSFWNRFTLALARLQERGGESIFRCCRCQRIRADAARHWREDGWLCHECYLFEMRHREKLRSRIDENPLSDEDD
jgi:F0F1-type ATP synthase assembly protein I